MTDTSLRVPVAPVVHQLTYTGKRSELFGIFVTNLLLTILSLGVYRFWGRVRMRRYLWANTHFYNEPFTYTGNGKELFIGFLKVLFFLFIPALLLLQVMKVLTASIIGGLGFVFFVSFISPCAVFWVRRYRLSRSSWRGIRLQQTGEVLEYAKKAILGAVLNFITLFYYVPYNAVNLLDYQINRIRFGTQYFAYDGTAEELRKNYIWIWGTLCALGLIAVSGVAICIAMIMTSDAFQAYKGMKNFAVLIEALKKERSLILIGTCAIVGHVMLVIFYFTYLVMRIKYKLVVFRHVASATKLGAMQFRVTATFWQFFRLKLGNFFLRVLSLGLLSPLAQHRSMMFMCRYLVMRGLPDFSIIRQVPAGSLSGEGWTQWLEVDAFDF